MIPPRPIFGLPGLGGPPPAPAPAPAPATGPAPFPRDIHQLGPVMEQVNAGGLMKYIQDLIASGAAFPPPTVGRGGRPIGAAPAEPWYKGTWLEGLFGQFGPGGSGPIPMPVLSPGTSPANAPATGLRPVGGPIPMPIFSPTPGSGEDFPLLGRLVGGQTRPGERTILRRTQ